jgi:fumarate reductase flavoprotein subunit
MSERAFDAVIIGAGLAGLAAANLLTQRGFSVAILERGAEELYPCNSRFSIGFINVAFQNIESDPQILRQAIDAFTHGYADPKLADMLARGAGPAMRWLKTQGIRFIRGGPHPGNRHMLAPPVPQRAGLNWEGRGPDLMLRRLAAKFGTRGGTLIRGMRAAELIMEAGVCTGVGATHAGQRTRFVARAVVIADGGFQADQKLLRQHVCARPERLLQRNALTGTGDGLRMAQAIGAGVTALDKFYGHVQSRDALTNPRLWPYPTVDFPITGGIAVDARARRFADEALGGVAMANAIAQLPDPLEAVGIFDHDTWRGRAKTFTLPANPFLVLGGSTIFCEMSLQALAQAAGLPPANLLQTVDDYNRALAQGAGARLDPPRSSAPSAPEPIKQPPFYAVPLCAGITHTLGGPMIDARCQVLRADRQPIRGLFAAGSTTGGVDGGPHAGYTSGLSKALVFGLKAAQSIASDLTALQFG